jgi:gamma-D-glutamyl-L-lysine dipeptidyl-peptidase
MKGINCLSILPVRSEPSDRSEMVTQLLFGEMYTILDEKDGWLLVIGLFDNYEGWIDKKMSLAFPEDLFEKAKDNPVFLVNDIIAKAKNLTDNSICHLVKGSVLPFLEKGIVNLGKMKFSVEGNVVEIPKNPDLSNLEKEALAYLDVPYLWGGRSPFGIDCSGFVQMVFRSCGMNLPRDASQQVNLGETVSFIFEASPGDLAFFDNASGSITHVGIIIGDGRVIHASGKVRIDRIDHNGIFNVTEGKYSHNLRIIKRVYV